MFLAPGNKRKKKDYLLVSYEFWARNRPETFLKIRPEPSRRSPRPDLQLWLA